MSYDIPTDSVIKLNKSIHDSMLEMTPIERMDFLALVQFVAQRWNNSIILNITNDKITDNFREYGERIMSDVKKLAEKFKNGDF